MCDLKKCTYAGAGSGQNVDVGIRAAIIDLPIGKARLVTLTSDSLHIRGSYDFNYLVYSGKGTFEVKGGRVSGNNWTMSLSFRGTWAADFDFTGTCGGPGDTCTFSGKDSNGVATKIKISFSNRVLWVRESIWIDVERKNWSIPELWFSPA